LADDREGLVEGGTVKGLARAALIVGLIAVATALGLYALHTSHSLKGRIGATRTFVPGSTRTELPAGKYVLYYELPGALKGFGEPHGLAVSVSPAGGGALPLHGYGGTLYVGSTGSLGHAFETVTLPRSEIYTIRATGPSSLADSGSTVVLGKPEGWLIFRVAGAGSIALLAAIFALVLLPPGWMLYLTSFLMPRSVRGQVRAARSAYNVMTLPSNQVGVFTAVPSNGSAWATAPPATDHTDLLTKLADLHDRGILTDAEFEAQKQRLLAQ
jgi:Short C-terminal domain